MRRALPLLLLAAVPVLVLVLAGGSGNGATNEWRPLTSAKLARTEVAAARIGRFVYVVGGFEQQTGETTGALERYDIERDTWKRLRPIPVGVNHPAAAVYRGRLYVHGGYRGRRDLSSSTPSLWRYSPRRNRWKDLAPAPTDRAAHALAVVGNRLYAAGGANAGGSLSSLEVYSFKRRRWSAGPSFPGPKRDHTTGVAAGGFFYVLAGRDTRDGPGNYTDAERFNPRTRKWERLPDMKRKRGGIASVRVGKRIVVFGGEEAATIPEVEMYDPATRRWTALPDMRTPRHGLGGVARGKRIFAIEGGPQPGFHFSNAIEYLDVP